MQDMTDAEYRRFMMGSPRTAALATVRADGRPHVAPIWFALDGDAVVFSTWHESVKAKNLLRDGRVSVMVDDETPPFSFVVIEGVASVEQSPDPAESLKWATLIGGRYMGADQADQYGQRNSVEGEYLIRVTPTKVIAKTGIAD